LKKPSTQSLPNKDQLCVDQVNLVISRAAVDSNLLFNLIAPVKEIIRPFYLRFCVGVLDIIFRQRFFV